MLYELRPTFGRLRIARILDEVVADLATARIVEYLVEAYLGDAR
jgi:hypothetical protein